MTQEKHITQEKKQTLECLREVIDPEIGLNIVDLGLIYGIAVDDTNQTIKVTMTLTTQFCPMGAAIVESVEETLQASFPRYEAIVALTFEPRWNAGMISEAGQTFLDG